MPHAGRGLLGLLTVAGLSACATAPGGSVAGGSVARGRVISTQMAQNAGEAICKRVLVTGTRFTSTECHTKADWDQMSSDARDDTASMERRTGNHDGR